MKDFDLRQYLTGNNLLKESDDDFQKFEKVGSTDDAYDAPMHKAWRARMDEYDAFDEDGVSQRIDYNNLFNNGLGDIKDMYLFIFDINHDDVDDMKYHLKAIEDVQRIILRTYDEARKHGWSHDDEEKPTDYNPGE